MSQSGKLRNVSMFHYRFLYVAIFIALASVFSGCSESDNRKNLTPSPTLASGQPFYRFVDWVEGASEGFELKVRVGSDYRNVLFTVSEDDPKTRYAASYVSPAVQVPTMAKLDFGIGLESPSESTNQAVSFVVTAVTESGREIVYEETLKPTDFRDRRLISWVDATIDLAHLAGKTAQFEFEASDVETARWANPVLHTTQPTRPVERPNIIFISLDTLGADHLGCYGYERDTSPNLDRLVKEGVLFEECFSPTSWTTPAHATAFTGLSPIVHGAGTIAGRRLRDSFTLVSEIMRSEGYMTGAYTEGAAVGGQLGFYQGFDNYSNGPAPNRDSPILKSATGIAARTFGKAQSWLDRYGHLPYMLFVHTYEIHWPYAPPDGYANRFTKTPVDPKAELGTMTEGVTILTHDPEKREIAKALYDGGIAYTDSIVGKFFSYLDNEGHLDNTIVVLFSDHGEAFWEHGLATHGTSLYREMLHVPLYIRLPKGQFGGTRVQKLVALADIFPTALELLGIDLPETGNANSLVPLFNDTSQSTYDRSVVEGHLWLSNAALQWQMISAQTEKGKYIITTDAKNKESPMYEYTASPEGYIVGEPELLVVDHLLNGGRDWWTTESEDERHTMYLSAREEMYPADNPDETQDISREDIEMLKEYRTTLRKYIEDEVATSGVVILSESVAPLTLQEKEELRALGYLED